jgi:ComF family protein
MLLSARQRLRFALDRMLAALPCCCALCGRSCGAALCAACGARHFGAGACRCNRCGLPLTASDAASPACGACLKQPPAFDRCIIAADYAAPLDQLVLGLKFGAQLATAPLFAALLQAALSQRSAGDDAKPDLLTAVPLGQARLAERGFNQSLEIARPLARALGIALAPRLLLRNRETPPQSLLPLSERRANVRRAFALTPEAIELVRGRHVGVVDDVMTTGATLDAVAATLKRFGAARVSCLVLARTAPK